MGRVEGLGGDIRSVGFDHQRARRGEGEQAAADAHRLHAEERGGAGGEADAL